MASLASQWSVLRRRLSCLFAVALCIEWCAAERGSSLADASSDGGIASDGAGAADTGSCMSVKKMVAKGEMPLGVYNLLTKKSAMKLYEGLVDGLSFSKRGKLNAFKCSTLYRAMYIGKHEQEFRKKGISIFLTKQDKGALASMRKSLIQVCFAEGANAQPPEHVYHDGREIKAEGHTYHETHSFPDGAVAQPYNRRDGGPMILADKSTMPVDLLKLLESKVEWSYRVDESGGRHPVFEKDALLLHADMAALINIQQFDPEHAKAVVGRFRKKFREVGIGLSFHESVIAKNMPVKLFAKDWVGAAPENNDLTDTVYWLQYVDLDVLDENLTPLKPKAPPPIAEPRGGDGISNDPSSPEEIQKQIEALQQKLREKLREKLLGENAKANNSDP